MNGCDRLVVAHERPMLVGPLENGTVQIPDRGETSLHQFGRQRRRPVADCAIGHDWCFLRYSRDGFFHRGARFYSSRTWKAAYVPFILGSHVEQDRLWSLLIRKPISEICRGNPLHFRKTVTERFLQENPLDATESQERESNDDQSRHKQTEARIRQA